MKHELFPADELGAGQCRAVEVDNVAIVVLRTPDGTLHALRDSCPHHRAPLSRGRIERQVVSDGVGRYALTDRAVLRCPWHGFEFDVETGKSVADPEGLRVRSYPVTVEAGKVVVER